MVCLAIHQTSLSVDGRSGFFSKNFAAKYFSGSLSSSQSAFCKCANFGFNCFREGMIKNIQKYSSRVRKKNYGLSFKGKTQNFQFQVRHSKSCCEQWSQQWGSGLYQIWIISELERMPKLLFCFMTSQMNISLSKRSWRSYSVRSHWTWKGSEKGDLKNTWPFVTVRRYREHIAREQPSL